MDIMGRSFILITFGIKALNNQLRQTAKMKADFRHIS